MVFDHPHSITSTATGTDIVTSAETIQQQKMFESTIAYAHTNKNHQNESYTLAHSATYSSPMFDSGDMKFSEDELLRTRMPLLNGENVEVKREEIREYFHRTFSIYEKLFDVLNSDESFYQQPEKLRHPLIFYFAHTATFYINKLLLAQYITKRINPKIESMCAVGVDEMSWDDLNTAHYDWPKVDEVRQYRDTVRVEIDALISRMELKFPITWESQFWPILMGIEHERIHLETSSVLIRQLNMKYVKPNKLFSVSNDFRLHIESVPKNFLLSVPSGSVSLGRPKSSYCYGWDNEYGTHDSSVHGFEASAYLVSNAEYFEFMEDGGYTVEQYWGEDGWRFITFTGATHPVFWIPADRDEAGNIIYKYRSMVSEQDMPWDWPVDVNNYEANAFCRWKASKLGQSVRLPTEDEWIRLRDHALENFKDQPYWPASERISANINLEHFTSSTPIDKFQHGQGFFDVIGNVWQHTTTPIYPFKGFQVHPLYDDFTVPTYDTRHFLMKGGSFISTGNESVYHARYAFRPHFYQHAGFRYIVSEVQAPTSGQVSQTETDSTICQSLDAHYGPDKLNVPNFYQELAKYAVSVLKENDSTLSENCGSENSLIHDLRALDIGCGPGRATFFLAKHFRFVHGLDTTARVIRLASRLQCTGSLQYCLKTEGDLETFREINLPELGVDFSTLEDSIEFMQCDPCNLDPKYSRYNLVLAANLLERLRSPTAFLSIIHSRIRPGGLLVLSSTFSWDETLTKKEEWIGGKKENGENVTSMAALQAILSPHFKLIRTPIDLACLSHINSRHISYGISQVTVWKKLE